jgi:curved DNA-binding protein CbpA
MSSPGTEPDHYQTLGVSRDASPEEIRAAYKRLAVRWHPDKNAGDKDRAEVMFKQIGEAYSVLSDPVRRADYDGSGGPAASAFSFGGLDEAFKVFDDFFGGDSFGSFDKTFDAAFEQGFGDGGCGDGLFDNDFFKGGAPSPIAAGTTVTSAATPPRARGGQAGKPPSVSASRSPAASASVSSTSTKTTTKVVDGKKVVTTETTVRTPDGNAKTAKRKERSGETPDQKRKSNGGPSPANKRSSTVAGTTLAVAGTI